MNWGIECEPAPREHKGCIAGQLDTKLPEIAPGVRHRFTSSDTGWISASFY